jgi:carboxymethylenebutenolidase
MPITTRTDTVTVADGSFDLSVWLPESEQGPGILLLQEIFGVGAYIRSVAERLAGLGYVVGAPDVFWRIAPRWAAEHDEAGLAASLGLMPKFDFAAGVADCVASLAAVRALPEVTGRVGVMGFCLGGLLTYQVAAHGDPDAAVSYYGSNIAAFLDLHEHITCPVQFHFGESDPYIPIEQVREIEARFSGRPEVEIHVQPGAGHAFDNQEAAMFHHPQAAAASWALTTGFLAKHLPVT